MKVAYLQPDAARAVGDRRLLGAAAARAAGALRDRDVVKRGAKRPPRGTDLSRLPRRQQPGRARLDRRRAAPHARASSSCTTSSSTISSRASRSRRGDGTAYLDALERDGGLVGAAARLRRDREAHPAAVGEPARGLPARRRGARPRDRADRPLALRPRPRPRGRVRGADLGRPASGLPGAGRSSRSRSRATPLFGAFGNVNASKRVAAAARSLRARPAAVTPRARLLLVGATSPGFDLDRRLQRLGLDGDGPRARGLRRRRTGSGR